MAAAPLFELQDVHKAYGTKVLFRGMNLVVVEGETLSVIGESGSGKSVCLKMMIGLIEPDRGRILFRGRDVSHMDGKELLELRRAVGYVFQSDALFDSLTVFENVGYAMFEHTDEGTDAIRARVEECLDMVGLRRNIMDQFPASLSGGMKKRVALARAVALRPEAILYDDPTGGLDPQNVTRIGDMLSGLRREIRTSVLATHDMKTAFAVSDRLAFLHELGFPFVGTPADITAANRPELAEFVRAANRKFGGGLAAPG